VEKHYRLAYQYDSKLTGNKQLNSIHLAMHLRIVQEMHCLAYGFIINFIKA